MGRTLGATIFPKTRRDPLGKLLPCYNRIFASRVAVRIFGFAAVAFGLVGLVWGDFAAVWQPVAKTVPGRTALAYAVAAALLLAGLAMQHRRGAAAVL